MKITSLKRALRILEPLETRILDQLIDTGSCELEEYFRLTEAELEHCKTKDIVDHFVYLAYLEQVKIDEDWLDYCESREQAYQDAKGGY